MVNKQVLITFVIGKYKDEVLCDVVPMEATHALLGRSWQYDRKILHGHANKISFNFQRRKIILKSLSSKEVNEDQIKMKTKRENVKGKENNKVKTSLIISPHIVKTVMLTRPKVNLRYSPSLSFSSTGHSKYLTYLLKKSRDNFQTASKGFHLLREPSQQIHFILKYFCTVPSPGVDQSQSQSQRYVKVNIWWDPLRKKVNKLTA